MNTQKSFQIAMKPKTNSPKTSAQPEKRHFKIKDFFHKKIKKTAVAIELRQGFSLFCCGKKIHFKRRLAVVQGSRPYLLSKAFTLLEILTVIAIIALLAGIFIPITGKAMECARKSTVSNNLRQVAITYGNFLSDDDYQKANTKTTLHDFAAFLAEKTDLNDPQFWIIKDDLLIEQFGSTIPHSIVSFNDQLNHWEVNEDFKKCPLSITLVKGISMNANASTTPIAWTRGLLPNGRWAKLTDPLPSVYGEKGGFIAFLDGHVKWYSDLNENGGSLVHYITRQPTSNIYDTLPPHASVLD